MHAVIINCHNQGAAALAKNPQAMQGASILIYNGIINGEIKDSSVVLWYIPIDQQIADGLSKTVPQKSSLPSAMHMFWGNKAVDIKDVGALILILSCPSLLLYRSFFY